MKKLFVSLIIILLIILSIFSILKYSIFSSSNAEIIFKEFLSQKSLPFNKEELQYDEVFFSFLPFPVLSVKNFSYYDRSKFENVDFYFSSSFLWNRNQKPIECVLKNGKMFFSENANNESGNLLAICGDLAKQMNLQLKDVAFQFHHSQSVFQLNGFINSFNFQSKPDYSVSIDIRLDSLNLKNGLISKKINDHLSSFIEFEKTDTLTRIKDYHLTYNNNQLPVYLNVKGELWKILIDCDSSKYSFSINKKGCSFLLNGKNVLFGDYRVKGGFYYTDQRFIEGTFYFNKDFGKLNSNKRGIASGEINFQNNLSDFENIEYFGKIFIKNYQDIEKEKPIQLNGVFTIKDNQLLAENVTAGYGKSFLKFGGRMNRFSQFIFHCLSHNESVKIPEFGFNATSQFLDFKEIALLLYKSPKLKKYLPLLPLINLNGNFDYSKASIGESIFFNDGQITFHSDSEKNIKVNISPKYHTSDYYFNLNYNYFDPKQHLLDGYYLLRSESLASLLETFYHYKTGIRSISKLTGNYQNHFNPVDNEVIVHTINGKGTLYQGIVKQDPLFQSIFKKYQLKHFQEFSFRHGQYEIFHDLKNHTHLLKDLNIASEYFSIKGDVNLIKKAFSFQGNLYVLQENYSYWKDFSNLNYDDYLKLYTAKISVDSIMY